MRTSALFGFFEIYGVSVRTGSIGLTFRAILVDVLYGRPHSLICSNTFSLLWAVHEWRLKSGGSSKNTDVQIFCFKKLDYWHLVCPQSTWTREEVWGSADVYRKREGVNFVRTSFGQSLIFYKYGRQHQKQLQVNTKCTVFKSYYSNLPIFSLQPLIIVLILLLIIC